jgi:undecaprenyl-diphosphatase
MSLPSILGGAPSRPRRGLWPRRTAHAALPPNGGPDPARHRRGGRAALLFALPAVLFALLAWTVGARHGAPLGPDRLLHGWAVGHRPPDLATGARLVASTAAGPLPYVAAMLAGWTGCSRRSGARQEVWAALGAVAVLVTGQGVRLAVESVLARPRPPVAGWAAVSTDWAFPSGYGTTSVLVAGLLGWAALRSDAPRGVVRVDVLACLCWAAAVSASRICLGVQWPTDEWGGWLLAGAWLGLTLPALSKLAGPTGPTGRAL